MPTKLTTLFSTTREKNSINSCGDDNDDDNYINNDDSYVINTMAKVLMVLMIFCT